MTIDKKFYGSVFPYHISDLSSILKNTFDELFISKQIFKDFKIKGANTLKLSLENEITFFENKKYISDLQKTNAGCIIIKPEFCSLVKEGISLIISNSPRKLFAYSLLKLFPDGFVTKNKSNISNTININKGVVLGQGVKIGKNVKIGSNTVIGNGVFIDDGTEIGSNCSIEYSEIGKNCIIYPGVRMGTTGFGFNFDDNGVYKFPHRGKVVIGDNVEIGANSTIDRGSLGDTILGNFVMVDNLVHIAHNVEIGNGCVICGQSGLAGSSKLGNNVILGAQVGVAGHVSIASGTVLSARTGVTKNINSPCLMGGFPAVPINEFRKQVATLRRISKK